MNIVEGLPKKAVSSLVAILLTFLFINALSPAVKGDRGGFSPRRLRVTETAQKAIIAWNGTREALILSTNVFSGNETEVVEIMPLPSNPSISKAETQSFTKVTDIVNYYFDLTENWRLNRYFLYSTRQSGSFGPGTAPRVSITFQEAIGFHFLTVVEAEDSEELTHWLKDFLLSRDNVAELPTNLNELIDM